MLSTLTELTILFSLRTARPIWASRPATLLLTLSVIVAAGTIALPFVPPLAAVFELGPPSPVLSLALLAILLGYVAANELLKRAAPRLLMVQA